MPTLNWINHMYLYRKIIALTVVVCFTITTVAWSAPSLPQVLSSINEKQNSIVSGIQIPEELGSVKQSFQGSGKELVIQIQNAHANYEAQTNIKRILKFLAKNHKVSFVGLEGATEPLNLESYDFFPYPDINLKIADYLAQKGEFTGAELLALEVYEGLENIDLSFVGVEEEEIYKKDLYLFKKGLKAQPEVNAFFNQYHKDLNVVKSREYHPELLKFDRNVQSFHQKHTPLLTYLATLERKAKDVLDIEITHPLNQRKFPYLCRMLRVRNTEKEMEWQSIVQDMKQLTQVINQRVTNVTQKRILTKGFQIFIGEDTRAFSENQSFITQLFRETSLSPRQFFELVYSASLEFSFNLDPYQNLRIFSENLILQSEVTGPEFFTEIEQLTNRIYDSLAKTKEEREVLALSRDVHFTEKLLKLEALTHHYNKIHSTPSQFTPEELVSRLSVIARQSTKESRQSQMSVIASQETGEAWQSQDLDALFTNALSFYELAEKRNAALVSNTLSKMRTAKHKRGAMVAGGFHTEGLSRILKEQNVSHLIITPRISTEFNRDRYHQAMTDSWETLFDESTVEDILTAVESINTIQRLGGNTATHTKQLLDAVTQFIELVIQREAENPDLRTPEALVARINQHINAKNNHLKQAGLQVTLSEDYDEIKDQFAINFTVALLNKSYTLPVGMGMVVTPTLRVLKESVREVYAVSAQSLGDEEEMRDIERISAADDEDLYLLLKDLRGKMRERKWSEVEAIIRENGWLNLYAPPANIKQTVELYLNALVREINDTEEGRELLERLLLLIADVWWGRAMLLRGGERKVRDNAYKIRREVLEIPWVKEWVDAYVEQMKEEAKPHIERLLVENGLDATNPERYFRVSRYSLSVGINILRVQISNLSALAGITSNVTIIQIENISQVEDLTPLAGFANLNILTLKRASNIDVTPLGNLSDLRVLRLSESTIENESALGFLIKLRELRLDNTNINDTSALENLVNLRNLYLFDTPNLDIQSVNRLRKKLPNLHIYGKPKMDSNDLLTGAIVTNMAGNSFSTVALPSNYSSITTLNQAQRTITILSSIRFSSNSTLLQQQIGKIDIESNPEGGQTAMVGSITISWNPNSNTVTVSGDQVVGISNDSQRLLFSVNDEFREFNPDTNELDVVEGQSLGFQGVGQGAADRRETRVSGVDHENFLLVARNVMDLTRERKWDEVERVLKEKGLLDMDVPPAEIRLSVEGYVLQLQREVSGSEKGEKLLERLILFLEDVHWSEEEKVNLIQMEKDAWNEYIERVTEKAMPHLEQLAKDNQIELEEILGGFSVRPGDEPVEITFIDGGWNLSNISALSGIENLKVIILSDDSSVVDITPVSSLTKLKEIFLDGTNIEDIEPLSNLTSLEYLDISGTKVKDLRPLFGLVNLKQIYISDMPELDLGSVEEFKRRLPDVKVVAASLGFQPGREDVQSVVEDSLGASGTGSLERGTEAIPDDLDQLRLLIDQRLRLGRTRSAADALHNKRLLEKFLNTADKEGKASHPYYDYFSKLLIETNLMISKEVFDWGEEGVDLKLVRKNTAAFPADLLVMSRDGRKAVITTEEENQLLTLFNMNNLRIRRVRLLDDGGTVAALSGNGRFALVPRYDKEKNIFWDLSEDKVMFDKVTASQFSGLYPVGALTHDGKNALLIERSGGFGDEPHYNYQYVSISQNGVEVVRELRDQQNKPLSYAHILKAYFYGPNEEFLFVSAYDTVKNQGVVYVWEKDSGNLIKEFRSQEIPFYDAHLSSDGKYLVTSAEITAPDLFPDFNLFGNEEEDVFNTAVLWDWSSETMIHRFQHESEGETFEIENVIFTPDSQYVLAVSQSSADEDHTFLGVWSLEGVLVNQFNLGSIRFNNNNPIYTSPTGHHFILFDGFSGGYKVFELAPKSAYKHLVRTVEDKKISIPDFPEGFLSVEELEKDPANYIIKIAKTFKLIKNLTLKNRVHPILKLIGEITLTLTEDEVSLTVSDFFVDYNIGAEDVYWNDEEPTVLQGFSEDGKRLLFLVEDKYYIFDSESEEISEYKVPQREDFPVGFEKIDSEEENSGQRIKSIISQLSVLKFFLEGTSKEAKLLKRQLPSINIERSDKGQVTYVGKSVLSYKTEEEYSFKGATVQGISPDGNRLLFLIDREYLYIDINNLQEGLVQAQSLGGAHGDRRFAEDARKLASKESEGHDSDYSLISSFSSALKNDIILPPSNRKLTNLEAAYIARVLFEQVWPKMESGEYDGERHYNVIQWLKLVNETRKNWYNDDLEEGEMIALSSVDSELVVGFDSFSPLGKRIQLKHPGRRHLGKVLELEERKESSIGYNPFINFNATFSPDERYVHSPSLGIQVGDQGELFRITTKGLQKIQFPVGARKISNFFQDGRTVNLNVRGHRAHFKIEENALKRYQFPDLMDVSSYVVLPNGAYAILVKKNYSEFTLVKLSKDSIEEVLLPDGVKDIPSFNADGNLVILVFEDSPSVLFDVRNRKVIAELPKKYLSFSSIGNYLIDSERNEWGDLKSETLYEIRDGKVQELELPEGFKDEDRGLIIDQYSPKGTYVSFRHPRRPLKAENGRLVELDLPEGVEIETAYSFSKDETEVVARSNVGGWVTLRLEDGNWGILNEEETSLPGDWIEKSEDSPDGSRFLVLRGEGENKRIQVMYRKLKPEFDKAPYRNLPILPSRAPPSVVLPQTETVSEAPTIELPEGYSNITTRTQTQNAITILSTINFSENSAQLQQQVGAIDITSNMQGGQTATVGNTTISWNPNSDTVTVSGDRVVGIRDDSQRLLFSVNDEFREFNPDTKELDVVEGQSLGRQMDEWTKLEMLKAGVMERRNDENVQNYLTLFMRIHLKDGEVSDQKMEELKELDVLREAFVYSQQMINGYEELNVAQQIKDGFQLAVANRLIIVDEDYSDSVKVPKVKLIQFSSIRPNVVYAVDSINRLHFWDLNEGLLFTNSIPTVLHEQIALLEYEEGLVAIFHRDVEPAKIYVWTANKVIKDASDVSLVKDYDVLGLVEPDFDGEMLLVQDLFDQNRKSNSLVVSLLNYGNYRTMQHEREENPFDSFMEIFVALLHERSGQEDQELEAEGGEEASAESLGKAEEVYGLMPEGYWEDERYRSMFLEKRLPDERILEELRKRKVDITPEVRDVITTLVSKVKFYDRNEGEEVFPFHLDILAALMYHNPFEDRLRIYDVLEAKGVALEDVQQIALTGITEAKMIDVGRGKGSQRDVDRILIKHLGGTIDFIAASDKAVETEDGSGVFEVDPLERSHSFVEYKSIKEFRAAPTVEDFADKVPVPYTFVHIEDSNPPIRIIFKEYVKGIDIQDWAKILGEAPFKLEDKQKIVTEIFYGIGRMFGEFYRRMGGWPNDMHFGNIVVYFNNKEGARGVNLRMPDYSGYSTKVGLMALDFSSLLLMEVPEAIEDLKLTSFYLNYVLKGIETTFPTQEEFVDFVSFVIKGIRSPKKRGEVQGILKRYKEVRQNVKIEESWEKKAIVVQARSLGAADELNRPDDQYLPDENDSKTMGELHDKLARNLRVGDEGRGPPLGFRDQYLSNLFQSLPFPENLLVINALGHKENQDINVSNLSGEALTRLIRAVLPENSFFFKNIITPLKLPVQQSPEAAEKPSLFRARLLPLMIYVVGAIFLIGVPLLIYSAYQREIAYQETVAIQKKIIQLKNEKLSSQRESLNSKDQIINGIRATIEAYGARLRRDLRNYSSLSQMVMSDLKLSFDSNGEIIFLKHKLEMDDFSEYRREVDVETTQDTITVITSNKGRTLNGRVVDYTENTRKLPLSSITQDRLTIPTGNTRLHLSNQGVVERIEAFDSDDRTKSDTFLNPEGNIKFRFTYKYRSYGSLSVSMHSKEGVYLYSYSRPIPQGVGGRSLGDKRNLSDFITPALIPVIAVSPIIILLAVLAYFTFPTDSFTSWLETMRGSNEMFYFFLFPMFENVRGTGDKLDDIRRLADASPEDLDLQLRLIRELSRVGRDDLKPEIKRLYEARIKPRIYELPIKVMLMLKSIVPKIDDQDLYIEVKYDMVSNEDDLSEQLAYLQFASDYISTEEEDHLKRNPKRYMREVFERVYQRVSELSKKDIEKLIDILPEDMSQRKEDLRTILKKGRKDFGLVFKDQVKSVEFLFSVGGIGGEDLSKAQYLSRLLTYVMPPGILALLFFKILTTRPIITTWLEGKSKRFERNFKQVYFISLMLFFYAFFWAFLASSGLIPDIPSDSKRPNQLKIIKGESDDPSKKTSEVKGQSLGEDMEPSDFVEVDSRGFFESLFPQISRRDIAFIYSVLLVASFANVLLNYESTRLPLQSNEVFIRELKKRDREEKVKEILERRFLSEDEAKEMLERGFLSEDEVKAKSLGDKRNLSDFITPALIPVIAVSPIIILLAVLAYFTFPTDSFTSWLETMRGSNEMFYFFLFPMFENVRGARGDRDERKLERLASADDQNVLLAVNNVVEKIRLRKWDEAEEIIRENGWLNMLYPPGEVVSTVDWYVKSLEQEVVNNISEEALERLIKLVRDVEWYEDFQGEIKQIRSRILEMEWVSVWIDDYIKTATDEAVTHFQQLSEDNGISVFEFLEYTHRIDRETLEVSIDLTDSPVSNLNSLRNIADLRSLNITGTQVEDLSVVSEITSLRKLLLLDVPAVDLRPLGTLLNLRSINLGAVETESNISDISVLNNLTNLITLELAELPIEDLSSVSNTLLRLKELVLYSPKEAYFKQLNNLTGLRKLTLSYSDISDEQIELLQAQLPNLTVTAESLGKSLTPENIGLSALGLASLGGVVMSQVIYTPFFIFLGQFSVVLFALSLFGLLHNLSPPAWKERLKQPSTILGGSLLAHFGIRVLSLFRYPWMDEATYAMNGIRGVLYGEWKQIDSGLVYLWDVASGLAAYGIHPLAGPRILAAAFSVGTIYLVYQFIKNLLPRILPIEAIQESSKKLYEWLPLIGSFLFGIAGSVIHTGSFAVHDAAGAFFLMLGAVFQVKAFSSDGVKFRTLLLSNVIVVFGMLVNYGLFIFGPFMALMGAFLYWITLDESVSFKVGAREVQLPTWNVVKQAVLKHMLPLFLIFAGSYSIFQTEIQTGIEFNQWVREMIWQYIAFPIPVLIGAIVLAIGAYIFTAAVSVKKAVQNKGFAWLLFIGSNSFLIYHLVDGQLLSMAKHYTSTLALMSPLIAAGFFHLYEWWKARKKTTTKRAMVLVGLMVVMHQLAMATAPVMERWRWKGDAGVKASARTTEEDSLEGAVKPKHPLFPLAYVLSRLNTPLAELIQGGYGRPDAPEASLEAVRNLNLQNGERLASRGDTIYYLTEQYLKDDVGFSLITLDMNPTGTDEQAQKFRDFISDESITTVVVHEEYVEKGWVEELQARGFEIVEQNPFAIVMVNPERRAAVAARSLGVETDIEFHPLDRFGIFNSRLFSRLFNRILADREKNYNLLEEWKKIAPYTPFYGEFQGARLVGTTDSIRKPPPEPSTSENEEILKRAFQLLWIDNPRLLNLIGVTIVKISQKDPELFTEDRLRELTKLKKALETRKPSFDRVLWQETEYFDDLQFRLHLFLFSVLMAASWESFLGAVSHHLLAWFFFPLHFIRSLIDFMVDDRIRSFSFWIPKFPNYLLDFEVIKMLPISTMVFWFIVILPGLFYLTRTLLSSWGRDVKAIRFVQDDILDIFDYVILNKSFKNLNLQNREKIALSKFYLSKAEPYLKRRLPGKGVDIEGVLGVNKRLSQEFSSSFSDESITTVVLEGAYIGEDYVEALQVKGFEIFEQTPSFIIMVNSERRESIMARALGGVEEQLEYLARRPEGVLDANKVPDIMSRIAGGDLELKGEMVDVIKMVKGKEVVVGSIDRAIADAYGLFHRVSVAFIITPEGELLMNRRAHHKSHPYKYSAYSETVISGESYEEAVRRGLVEELNLPKDWRLQGSLSPSGGEGGFQLPSDSKVKLRFSTYVYVPSEEEMERIDEGKKLLDRKKNELTRQEYEDWLKQRYSEGDSIGELWSIQRTTLDDLISIAGGREVQLQDEFRDGPFITKAQLAEGLKVFLNSPDLVSQLRETVNAQSLGLKDKDPEEIMDIVLKATVDTILMGRLKEVRVEDSRSLLSKIDYAQVKLEKAVDKALLIRVLHQFIQAVVQGEGREEAAVNARNEFHYIKSLLPEDQGDKVLQKLDEAINLQMGQPLDENSGLATEEEVDYETVLKEQRFLLVGDESVPLDMLEQGEFEGRLEWNYGRSQIGVKVSELDPNILRLSSYNFEGKPLVGIGRHVKREFKITENLNYLQIKEGQSLRIGRAGELQLLVFGEKVYALNRHVDARYSLFPESRPLSEFEFVPTAEIYVEAGNAHFTVFPRRFTPTYVEIKSLIKDVEPKLVKRPKLPVAAPVEVRVTPRIMADAVPDLTEPESEPEPLAIRVEERPTVAEPTVSRPVIEGEQEVKTEAIVSQTNIDEFNLELQLLWAMKTYQLHLHRSRSKPGALRFDDFLVNGRRLQTFTFRNGHISYLGANGRVYINKGEVLRVGAYETEGLSMLIGSYTEEGQFKPRRAFLFKRLPGATQLQVVLNPVALLTSFDESQFTEKRRLEVAAHLVTAVHTTPNVSTTTLITKIRQPVTGQSLGYAGFGQDASQIERLKRSLELDPESKELKARLGYAYLRIGNLKMYLETLRGNESAVTLNQWIDAHQVLSTIEWPETEQNPVMKTIKWVVSQEGVEARIQEMDDYVSSVERIVADILIDNGMTEKAKWPEKYVTINYYTQEVSVNFLELPIENIEGLVGLTNLVELDLTGAMVVDISVLKNLKSLKSLTYLYPREQIKVDLRPLSNLTQLKELTIDVSALDDVSFFNKFVDLEILNLEELSQNVKGIDALNKLTKLKNLGLYGSGIKDLHMIRGLTNLRSLTLMDSSIEDFSIIGTMLELEVLHLHNEEVEDLAFLKNLTKLKVLSLDTAPVGDISVLSHLRQLTDLDLRLTAVEDFRVLAELPKLKRVNLSQTEIASLEAIEGLRELIDLSLFGARHISQEEIRRLFQDPKKPGGIRHEEWLNLKVESPSFGTASWEGTPTNGRVVFKKKDFFGSSLGSKKEFTEMRTRIIAGAADQFSGRILSLQVALAIYNQIMTSWYPEAFAAEGVPISSQVISFNQVLPQHLIPEFKSINAEVDGFSITIKTDEHFSSVVDPLELAMNTKSVLVLLSNQPLERAEALEEQISLIRDENNQPIGDRIIVIPIQAGREIESIQSFLSGKHYGKLRKLAQQLSEVPGTLSQNMIQSRTTVFASDSVLDEVTSDYIQRLEVVPEYELETMGISQEDFNEYAATHAHLLALTEGNLNHPLLKPVRSNLEYHPESDRFLFNRTTLRARILALQAAIQAYEATLASA